MRFRKKPIEVEAMLWTGGAAAATPIIDWVLRNGGTARWNEERREGMAPYRPDDLNVLVTPEHIAIDTTEGTMRVSPGDWVIQGTRGEFYPCKPGPFADTFEWLDEPPPITCLAQRWKNSEPRFDGDHKPHAFHYGEHGQYHGQCAGWPHPG